MFIWFLSTLGRLRDKKDVGMKKDLYLVFFIREFDAKEIQDLRDVINDTHVCRKICLELNGHSLKETLNDIPFLSKIRNVNSFTSIRL